MSRSRPRSRFGIALACVVAFGSVERLRAEPPDDRVQDLPSVRAVPQVSQLLPHAPLIPLDPMEATIPISDAPAPIDTASVEQASSEAISIRALACSCDCPTTCCGVDCGCCDQCAPADECDACDACCEACGHYYLQFDALIVTRSNAALNQPVVLADDTGDTVLSTRDLTFNWTAGPRAFLGCVSDGGPGWEIGYFGVFSGLAAEQAIDPNNLDIPPPLVAVANDFDNADVMTLTWNWHVNNAEANWLYGNSGAQFLAGFRYFNLEEQFNIQAQDSDGDVSDYHISTSNNLYGGQLGGRLRYEGEFWAFGVVGKAGIYTNDAIERQTVGDNDNTFILRDARGRDTATSFVGDLDLFLSARFNDTWRVRGGYYLLWVTQVALAPDQLDFSFDADSGTQVRDRGDLFMHGATIGLEAGW